MKRISAYGRVSRAQSSATDTSETAENPRTAGRGSERLRFIRDFNLVFGVSVLLLFSVFALFPKLIAKRDPLESNYDTTLSAPSREHLLGTDEYGRDILSRVVHAARLDLLIAVASVAIGLVIGGTLGLVAGYYGGLCEGIVMRGADSILAFPPFILALLVIALLGSSTTNTLIAISIVYIPLFARLTRASTLVQRRLQYVEASRISGATDLQIMFKSILPNIAGALFVQTALYLGTTLLVVAGLGYLGLGVQPPTPSWGSMLQESQNYRFAWWFVLFPGACVFLVVLAFSLVGDGLRDVLDPSLRRRD
jgi:peptide/nickel transport system permease protein